MHLFKAKTRTATTDIDWIKYGRIILSVHVHVWHGDCKANVYLKRALKGSNPCFSLQISTKLLQLSVRLFSASKIFGNIVACKQTCSFQRIVLSGLKII